MGGRNDVSDQPSSVLLHTFVGLSDWSVCLSPSETVTEDKSVPPVSSPHVGDVDGDEDWDGDRDGDWDEDGDVDGDRDGDGDVDGDRDEDGDGDVRRIKPHDAGKELRKRHLILIYDVVGCQLNTNW